MVRWRFDRTIPALLTAVAVIAVIGAPRPVIAREQSIAVGAVSSLVSPPVAPPRINHRSWYGHQIILADLAGVVATTGCAVKFNHLACAVPYPTPSSAVHLVHHQSVARILGGIAMRIAFPVVGGAIGQATCNRSDRLCGLQETLVGALIGAVLATSVDAVLSYENIDVAAKERR